MATKKKTLLIIFLIYLLALAPRLYQLSATAVYVDEITWMVNGKELLYAIKNGNINYLKNGWWTTRKETYAIGLPAVVLSGLSDIILTGDSKFGLHLLSDIVASRLPIVLIGATLSPLIFYYISLLINPTVGLVAAITYAVNPTAIGLDRWLIHDSFLTLFSFVALCSYLLAVRQKKSTYFPGFMLALAFLTKPNGLIPVVGWLVLLITCKFNRFNIGLLFKNFISFLVTVLLVWPSSWFSPIVSIWNYLWQQVTVAQIGLSNFYLGKPTVNPGWTFYFFQLFFKTPEVVLILFIIGIIILFRYFTKKGKLSNSGKSYLAAAIYACSYFGLITFTIAKSGLRYALPILPWVYVLAAVAFVLIYQKLKPNLGKLLLIIFLVGSAVGLLNHPNHYTYYNTFIGGAANAQKIDRVGFCFGSKEPLEYLDQHLMSGSVYVLGCPSTAPYYTARQEIKDFTKADYVIIESAWAQVYSNSPVLKGIKHRQLIFESNENGVILGRLYH